MTEQVSKQAVKIDFDTYKRKFGTKNKKTREYQVAVSEDVYNLLSEKERFGIAFTNEIFLSLMEDVMVAINAAILDGDKGSTLKPYKKLGINIKKVLEKSKAEDLFLTDRYYDIAPSPIDRDVFVSNPLVMSEKNVTDKISHVLASLGMFYRAINTKVGNDVYKTLINEKKKSITTIYENKNHNGTSVYYTILNAVIGIWQYRIRQYESHAKSLKLINGGIKNVRKSKYSTGRTGRR